MMNFLEEITKERRTWEKECENKGHRILSMMKKQEN